MKIVSQSGQPLLRESDRLEAVPITGFELLKRPVVIEWRSGLPEVEIEIPPESIAIYRVVK